MKTKIKNKSIFFFIVVFFYCGSIVFSQTYNIPASGTQSYNTCSGNFYDAGGGGNYSNNESGIITFCSNAGNCVRVTFSSFNIESSWDYLYIYDGPNTSSPLIGTYTGTTSPGTVTSTGGCLTFRFYSDGSVVYSGWTASISCVTCSLSPSGNYSFTSANGSYTANSSPTTIHSAGVDDALSSSIGIGFTFRYNCNDYTSIKVSSNGWLSFNTSLSSSYLTNDLNNQSNNISNPLIVAPLWDDVAVGSGGTVNYKLTGTSPNRILTVEWNRMEWSYSATTWGISFQTKLYETSNRIEFIYQRNGNATQYLNSPSASIGLMGSLTGNFYSLNGTGSNPTASTATETDNLSSKPASGQIYRWDPQCLSGANCSNPTIISSLPYSAAGLTTCGYSNDYTSANACASVYMNGEDYVFSYTPSSNISVDISLTGTLTWTGIFVTQGCPNSGSCVAQATSSSGNPSLCSVALTGGTTYYIIVDTWPPPNCTPFNITVQQSGGNALSYTVSSISYNADNYNSGTLVPMTDDQFSGYIPIGFNFSFDGAQYNQLLISSNGYVIFDPMNCSTNLPSGNATPGGYSDWSISAAIPNTSNAPRNAILGPWQDIDASSGGDIRYQTLGTAPNRRFVVSYFNIPMYGSGCNGNSSLHFRGQIKLYETTNEIEVHLANKRVCSSWNGGTAILGLQNNSGTLAVVPVGGYNYPTQWNATNGGVRFSTSPFPVTWLDFSGIYKDEKVFLNWSTASETNCDYFEIEKSSNGISFVSTGRVEGAGNSSSMNKYSVIDTDPYDGINYYRLRQVDFNGDFSYSNIIAVKVIGQSILSVYPNPAQSYLIVELPEELQRDEEMNIYIVNLLGKKEYELKAKNEFWKLALDISTVQNGTHLIILQSSSEIFRAVFMKE